ncbi:hypothetical protein ACNOYE_06070 [Nannocystaceae bacterium ST9]
MTRVHPPELRHLVHESVPRMIVALGMPRSLARKIAQRGCSSAASRERLIYVRDEAWSLAKQRWQAGQKPEAERAELLATITGLLALVLDVRGHDPELADAMIDRALALCTSWAITELAVHTAKPERLHEGWALSLARWFAGRRKPSVA